MFRFDIHVMRFVPSRFRQKSWKAHKHGRVFHQPMRWLVSLYSLPFRIFETPSTQLDRDHNTFSVVRHF